MKIALHGKPFIEETIPCIDQVVSELGKRDVELWFSEEFAKTIEESSYSTDTSRRFAKLESIPNVDYVFSIGGDGTLLETVTQVNTQEIPILGINTGRLGFLATISRKDITSAISSLFEKDFSLDQRSLLRLETKEGLFGDLNFALNEATVVKKDSSSMIKVICNIDDQYLNTYWADGLMISTPTGSTGYSLSCGGPVILPQSNNFLITPINPHNLNVRPMVVSDSNVISIEVDSRGTNFLASLDSRSETVDSSVKMTIKRESFQVKLIKLKGFSFLDTLRNKLNWGFDVRN